MAGARALIPAILVSVFLFVIFVIPHASAIEKPGSDPTRPSDSIKAEEQEEVQVDESGGKNVPSPPKLDQSIYDVVVIPDEIYFYHYSLEQLDRMLPGLTKEMYMYVNGKKLALNGEELYRGLVPTPALTPYSYPHPYTYSYTFKMPSDRPLSIMVFGYLKAECPQPILPIDISKDVIAANGEKDALLRLLRGLTENIESPCGVDTGDDPNDPHDNTPIRRHVFLGYINEVYEPPSYDAGPHVENSKINALSQSIVPDPNFRLKYSIKVTPPVNTDVVQK